MAGFGHDFLAASEAVCMLDSAVRGEGQLIVYAMESILEFFGIFRDHLELHFPFYDWV